MSHPPAVISCGLLLGLLFALPASPAAHAQTASRAALLSVTNSERPNDTGNDTTKLSFEEHKDLGGQALKVQFGPGDSFGVQQSKVTNWKPYTTLRFDAFNPSTAVVKKGSKIFSR